MTLYADTADLEQLEEMLSLGIFGGITTNPAILEKANPENYEERIAEICRISPGSVSVELTNNYKDYDKLVQEAKQLNAIDPDKIVIKVPMWQDGTGVALGNELTTHGIKVNMTCLMSVNQAIVGSLAGSTYVSLFYNRMIDYYGKKGKKGEDMRAGRDAAELHIEYTRSLLDRFGWNSKIIAGSIRSPEDVALCLLRGADIVTVPYPIYKKLFFHPKTQEAITEFDEAWKKYRAKNR